MTQQDNFIVPSPKKNHPALIENVNTAVSRQAESLPPTALAGGAGRLDRPGMLNNRPDGSLGHANVVNPPSPPILDTFPITARSSTNLPSSTTQTTNNHPKAWWLLTPEEKLQKKFNRAYHRYMLGRGFDGSYRLVTLTTPETFTGDIHQAWRKWVMRMRRRGLAREYFAVKEWNKNKTCVHIHAVLRLSYIEYQIAREQWKAVTGAVWIQVEKVYSAKGMANYLAKYLNKGYAEVPGKRGYWYAYEWVHRKWRAFGKAMYKLGETVTPTEFELIHGIQGQDKRNDYMNWRMAGACLGAIRSGTVEGDTVELTQFN